METETFKHLLSPVNLEPNTFFYSDFNCNLYRGCNHGCIYCDSRSICYRLDRFDTVRVKQNVIEILRQELRLKRKTGIISIGSMSDSYNPFEKEECITRQALELIAKERFGFALSTKSALVARDASLLHRISQHAPVGISFSITTCDDALSRILEPGASVSSQRFEAMRTLSSTDVFCGTWMNPMLPFLTDTKETIKQIVSQTKANGGKYVVCFFSMTLRTGSREYFFNALDKHFPGMKLDYTKSFGNSYEIISAKAKELHPFFVAECQREGLLYSFKDINRAFMQPKHEQLSLF